ncbi:MAG TPA: DnaB-like helicase N-terminal domain-containing protein, partial [Polyangia bacterium]|nr:DnaB-like helicase N-terminal domain-containing protein [Polyangia bacterium]
MLELASNNTQAQRSQPHNLDAEKSVLGSVFIKPAAFDEIATTLQVDDFFLPAHREVFDAMLALDKRRQPIDVIAVADELRTRGMLPRLEGGMAYLTDLANSVPTAENSAHYGRLVKEKATLRRLIAACAEVQSSAYGDFGEFESFLDEAETKIF